MLRSLALPLFATLITTTAPLATAQARTISFSGYQWNVRADGVGGPRNNNWCDANASVDSQGFLHLKLTKRSDGSWCAVQVSSVQRMGFGTYQWQLNTRVDTLDKNVVFGLFHYPTADVGPDGTNEIDIEFTKWGNAAANILNYTVYPTLTSIPGTTVNYPMALNDGDWSTHRYIWKSQSIRFQSTHGHYDNNPLPIADYTFAPGQPNRIGQQPMPVFMNLWITAPPSNNQPVEIVVSNFKFTPQ